MSLDHSPEQRLNFPLKCGNLSLLRLILLLYCPDILIVRY
ncbi:hypothetical protein PROSTU_01166 [Providencia stuartii ATCC 25827]|uniref:Uncharacterized protein n=1 Tax=Providencia stuartii ATCC 25827 TaxID=471874 RepID=A0AA87CS96_PROST|nr:hypothetical protein PROSTU_01166 [Providencia stuartii ATCC 25827]